MNYLIIKYFMIIIIIYIILMNLNFLTLLNDTYKVKNNIKFNKGQLIVCSHDYEHIDIFIMIQEIIKQKRNVSIVFTYNILSYLLYFYLQFIGINYITFHFNNGGTVGKMINTIQNNETCFIYSFRNNEQTGIYYTLQETNCPLILCQIQSDHEYTNLNDNSGIISVIMNNIGKEYYIKYKEINYNLFENDKKFIKKIKQMLYYK